MRARVLAILEAWREDWQATNEGKKVVVLILAAAFVAWAIFAVWFWMGFDF